MTNIVEQYVTEAIDYRKLKKQWVEAGEAPSWVSTNAVQFFSQKYSYQKESWKKRVEAVCRYLADNAPSVYPDWWEEDEYTKGLTYYDVFFKLRWDGFTIDSTPLFTNAGLLAERGMTISCSGQTIFNNLADKDFAMGELVQLIKNGHGCAWTIPDWLAEGDLYGDDGNRSDGILPIIEEAMEYVQKTNQGVRRGACAFNVNIEHGDFDKVADFLYKNNHVLNLGWIIKDEFIKKLFNKDTEALRRFGRIVQIRMLTGKGYFLKTDTMNRNKADVFKELALEVYGSNLCCVTGYQLVLTKEHGLATAKWLYENPTEGGLTLFDGKKEVKSSNMKYVKDAKVVNIYLDGGLMHTVTLDHKLSTLKGIVEAGSLQKGDFVEVNRLNPNFDKVLLQEEVWELLSLIKNLDTTYLCHGDFRTIDKLHTVLASLGIQCYDNPISNKEISLFVTDEESMKELGALLNLPVGENLNYAQPFKRWFLEVMNIEDFGVEPTYCVEVDSEEHLWVCNGVVTHNCELNLPANADLTFSCPIINTNLTLYRSFPKHLHWLTMIMQDANVTGYLKQIEQKKGKSRLFLDKIHRFTEEFRAVGCGTAGFHSLLMQERIVYGSFESEVLNDQIFSEMQRDTYEASKWLGEVCGVPKGLQKAGINRRNATTMFSPPTKSSAEYSRNTPSEGIGLQTALIKVKEVTGSDIWRIEPAFLSLLKEKGLYTPEMVKDIAQHNGSIQHLDCFTEHEKKVFKTAFEIDMIAHLKMCAGRQPYFDQQQSINIYLSGSDSVEYITEVHLTALALEGINSLYYCYSIRDGQFVREIEECLQCQ